MPASASTFETIPVRAPERASKRGSLAVTSQSFGEGATIGRDFVHADCGGANTSPHLRWTNGPPGTKSFAITCFDPDAPTGSGYWHWLVFDIPAATTSVEAGVGTGGSPAGGRSGYSDFSISSYGGPCPPDGDAPHRYVFTVYALDVESLGADETTTGATLIFKMRGHVLATGSITGLFGH